MSSSHNLLLNEAFPQRTLVDGQRKGNGSWRITRVIVKGTVSPDCKCLEVISIKSPLLGHVTPDIKKFLNSSFNF
jgi:hypothetical protein